MRPILALFSLFSRLVCRLKRTLYARGILKAARAPIPVIGVGNLTLGGSGKTPLVMELMERLRTDGFRPALVSRGYRGGWEASGGVVSDGTKLLAGPAEAGDEPYMAALRVPRAGVFVGRDRLASCRRAAEAGFDVAVLDDGFQHLRLARDLDVVLDAPERGAVLREGRSALKSAGIVIRTGDGAAAGSGPGGASLVFTARTRPDGLIPFGSGDTKSPAGAEGTPFFAFCGIARPERFFNLLESLGLHPAACLSFPDHHDYPDRSLDRIAEAARAAGARLLVATEKDAAKLRGRLEERTGLPAAFLRIRLDLPEAFYAAVEARLKTPAGGRP